MNKTTSITIGGILFHLDDSAYQKLSAYLKEVGAYFEKVEGDDEIMRDIEARISEGLHGMRKSPEDVLSLVQVEQIIAQMGTVEDFERFGEEGAISAKSGASNKVSERRKFYRDPDNAMLGGVCAGIGRYFAIDPVIVRVVFILAFLVYGAGIFIYLLLWIFAPKADTPEKKSLMRGGGSETLVSIRERAEKTATTVRENSGRISTGVRKTFHAVMKIISVLISVGFLIVGAVILFGSFALGVYFIFLTGQFAFNAIPWYINFPIAEAAYGTASYFTVLFSGFLVFLIPCLVGMLVGWYFVSKKTVVGRAEFFGGVGIWIVCFIIGGLVFAQAAPSYVDQIEATQVQIHQKTFPVADFNSIEFEAGILFDHITVKKGATTSVRVSGSQGVYGHLNVEVENGVLAIHERRNDGVCILCSKQLFGSQKEASLTITAPKLQNVRIYGGRHVSIGDFALKNLVASAAPYKADWNVSASAEQADIRIYDHTKFVYQGSAGKLQLFARNSATFLATSSSVQELNVDLLDNSTAKVRVSDSITGNVYDGSKLIYFGRPEVDVDKDEKNCIDMLPNDDMDRKGPHEAHHVDCNGADQSDSGVVKHG